LRDDALGETPHSRKFGQSQSLINFVYRLILKNNELSKKP
jgi:hypothetical protein